MIKNVFKYGVLLFVLFTLLALGLLGLRYNWSQEVIRNIVTFGIVFNVWWLFILPTSNCFEIALSLLVGVIHFMFDFPGKGVVVTGLLLVLVAIYCLKPNSRTYITKNGSKFRS
jgi:hypothetical protein